MKKITALILAMMMSFALSIGANAALSADESDSREVRLEVIQRNDSEKIYSVDVSWPNLSFTYNHGTGTWNPATHSYTQSGQNWVTTQHHSALEEGNGLKSSNITITNHSNAGIKYEAEYSKGDLDQNGVTVSLVGVEEPKTLPSAEGKAMNAAELIGEFYVQVEGTPNKKALDPTKIGTVTITISPVT